MPLAKFSNNNIYQESLKMAPLKCYTDIDAVHHSIGLSQERKSYLVLTSSMKPKQRYAVFKTT
jgi:hypothetical protein